MEQITLSCPACGAQFDGDKKTVHDRLADHLKDCGRMIAIAENERRVRAYAGPAGNAYVFGPDGVGR